MYKHISAKFYGKKIIVSGKKKRKIETVFILINPEFRVLESNIYYIYPHFEPSIEFMVLVS